MTRSGYSFRLALRSGSLTRSGRRATRKWLSEHFPGGEDVRVHSLHNNEADHSGQEQEGQLWLPCEDLRDDQTDMECQTGTTWRSLAGASRQGCAGWELKQISAQVSP